MTAPPSADLRTVISTPDRRLRVFVSSTLRELAEERRAVREAITQQRLAPVMFELGARPYPPRDLYRAYLAQSDVFIGIYGDSYGWVAPGEDVSGLEDEYQLAGERPKLIYVKEGSHPEARLQDLLKRIRDDDRASYQRFASASQLADQVADDLAVLLTDRFTSAGPSPSSGVLPGRVPSAATEIIGREPQIQRTLELVRDPSTRAVTVTGPGGIGKTRLALAVASLLQAARSHGEDTASRDGVWFVDLTPVTDPGPAVELIAAAFGVRPENSGSLLDLLVDRLRNLQLVLILDNFEQVHAAAAAVAQLLAGCPGMTLVATSRSALAVRGEHLLPLIPLSTPSPRADTDLAQLAQAPAVALFTARAQQVRPGFALTADNAAAVVELCRRLDGLPLALELAAAQLRIQTPSSLLHRLGERLERSLDLTADVADLPVRQQTLRATLEWSYGLLSEDERLLFARLSVFAQSWGLDAANAVGQPRSGGNAAATLSSLVGQSLVNPVDASADELRFTMLTTVRGFAAEKLQASGEEPETRHRLRNYITRLAAAAGTELAGPNNRQWAARIDTELEDIRAAMQRAVADDDAEAVVQIASPLFSYWWSRGLLDTMQQLAERAAALPSAAALTPDAAALLLWARGMNRISAGHVEQAQPYLRQLLSAADSLHDARLRAFALAGLGLAQAGDDPRQPQHLLEESVATMRDLGDKWGLAFTLSVSGQLARQRGDPASAEELHAEALTAAQAINNDHLRSQLLDLLGLDAIARHDTGKAREHFRDAASIHAELLDQEGSSNCLDGFAAVALSQGRPHAAASLLAAARRARDVVHVSVWPGLQDLVDQLGRVTQEALDRSAYADAQAEGMKWSLAEALDYACSATEAEAAATGTAP